MSDDTNKDTTDDMASGEGMDIEPTAVTAEYKVLGQHAADNGVGVLGQNDASNGTPVGVEGAVPNNSAGYGLSTPDDTRIEGDIESTSGHTLTVDGTPTLELGPTNTDEFSRTSGGNVIAGYKDNGVQNGAVGATVSGGGASGGNQRDNVNAVTDDYGTIGGGLNNRAAKRATVGGGRLNTASGTDATIGGGFLNTVAGIATVAGGSRNDATSLRSTVAGGLNNTASGEEATVAGGYGNEARGKGTTVAGGGDFSASAPRNVALDSYGTIGGGDGNQTGASGSTTATFATVGGGRDNTASGTQATVSGGAANDATGDSATVGGGRANTANAERATVGGGGDFYISGFYYPGNLASGTGSVVSGGGDNTASGASSTIGGGSGNTAGGSTGGEDQDAYQTVAGGVNNEVTAKGASVGGGGSNQADGSYATVPGGENNRGQADYTFAAGRRAKAQNAGSFVWSDSADDDFASTGNDQFLVDAAGGVGVGTNSPSSDLDVEGTVSISETGVQVDLGGFTPTISSGSPTTVQFSNASVDPRNEYDTSAYEFSPDIGGNYRVSVQLTWEDPEGFELTENKQIETRIMKNSSRIAASQAITGSENFFSTSVTKTVMNLSPSDSLSIEVLHDYGTDLTFSTDDDATYAEYIRVG